MIDDFTRGAVLGVLIGIAASAVLLLAWTVWGDATVMSALCGVLP